MQSDWPSYTNRLSASKHKVQSTNPILNFGMLKNLLQSAPKTEPIIRIFPNYLSLNAKAVELLGISDGDSVSIMQDDRDNYIYVSNNPEAKVAYGVRRRVNTYEVCNSRLCRKLAEQMEGFGAYRICEEQSIEFMGHQYYNVFAKKYGKD